MKKTWQENLVSPSKFAVEKKKKKKIMAIAKLFALHANTKRQKRNLEELQFYLAIFTCLSQNLS